MKILDEETLATCPTDGIEQEIEEAEDITSKIAEMQVEIDGRSQGKTKKISGKPHDETVVHMVSNKDELRTCHMIKKKVRDKKGAPSVLINVSDSLVEGLLVKPRLPKITLPRFMGKITEFRGFWNRYKLPFTITHHFRRYTDSLTYTSYWTGWPHGTYKVWHLPNYQSKLQGSDTNSEELIWQHTAGDIRPYGGPFKASCLPWR